MKIRKGMWVVAEDGQVGIVNDIRFGGADLLDKSMAGPVVEFHRVGAEGLTELVLLLDPATLVQARWREIPEDRRPDRVTAAKFGYA